MCRKYRDAADAQGGGRQSRIARKLADTGGMTLIELIVGLAISSVVSVMAAQFFSIAVRLHRSSTEISALQKEAQTITAQLERSIMAAEEVYFFDSGSGSYLLLGRETGEGADVEFAGQIFYYDRSGKKFYIDADYRERSGKQALFNNLRAQSEIGRIENTDYLVSNKVEELVYSLSKETREMTSLGNHAYGDVGTICITATLTMQYHESRSYDFTTKAMPRQAIAEITWHDAR